MNFILTTLEEAELCLVSAIAAQTAVTAAQAASEPTNETEHPRYLERKAAEDEVKAAKHELKMAKFRIDRKASNDAAADSASALAAGCAAVMRPSFSCDRSPCRW